MIEEPDQIAAIPGAIDQAHTIDEWISLDQLNAAVDAYTRVIRTCLKGQTMNR